MKIFGIYFMILIFCFSFVHTQDEHSQAEIKQKLKWDHYIATNFSIINGKQTTLTYGYAPKDIEISFYFSSTLETDDSETSWDYNSHFLYWDMIIDGIDTTYIPVFQENESISSNDSEPDFYRKAGIHLTKLFHNSLLGKKNIIPYCRFGLTHLKRIDKRSVDSNYYRADFYRKFITNGLDFSLGLKSELQIYHNLFIEFDYSVRLSYLNNKSYDRRSNFYGFPPYIPNPIEYLDESYLSDFRKTDSKHSDINFSAGPLLLLLKYYF